MIIETDIEEEFDYEEMEEEYGYNSKNKLCNNR